MNNPQTCYAEAYGKLHGAIEAAASNQAYGMDPKILLQNLIAKDKAVAAELEKKKNQDVPPKI